MKTQRISGGGGVQLHVVETGPPAARPILFLHGFSQSSLAWSRQLNSDLANDFRLVALDLRGHGMSDKPRDGYADSRLWADDVNAVIKTLDLERPILCCWSYGMVPLDYIRHYSDSGLGGIHLVGTITKLGSEDAMSVLTPEALATVPGLFTTDAEEGARNQEKFLKLCFAQEPSVPDLYLMLGYNLTVPPRVRQALFSRSVDNDDLLPKIRKPVLITHGTLDAIVSPVAVDRHKAAISHAQVHLMRCGHAPFWEDAAEFNRRLRAFADTL